VQPENGDKTAKFASAHNPRRSFGERWAARGMPQVLMEMMSTNALKNHHSVLRRPERPEYG